MEELEVPLVVPEFSPVQVPADYYYRLRTRSVYKSYPIYMLGREPTGYIESLGELEPEIILDISSLKTREDWVRAGEKVFDAPTQFIPYSAEELEFLYFKWHDRMNVPDPPNGVVPYFDLVIREKGKLEIGVISCRQCHIRVMPDGTLIKGAQGNFPNVALGYEKSKAESLKANRFLYATPWMEPDPIDSLGEMSLEEIYELHAAIPPGVIPRHRTTPFLPVQVPDLIGVQDRKYLDRTGLQQHRGIVDLMRYAALNSGGDNLADFAGFVPVAMYTPDGKLPPPESGPSRWGDPELYALALYIYSLKPPENPNPFDETAARGQEVFQAEGCGGCHTPPLYTNNKLTPVQGFDVPAEHRERYDILDVSVGTDPGLATKTRRGTGYYKVPSLKGVWYRGHFGHDGSCQTLEDWFDPARLQEDYVPTGFKGYKVDHRAVPGHEFGLKLPPGEKAALIAFLRTI